MKEKVAQILIALLVIATNNIHSANAIEFKTLCGRTRSEETVCRMIKGDAVLQGEQGFIHTLIFPNGEKRQYFYTGGYIGGMEGLLVRINKGPWLSATDNLFDGRIYFQLPSGNIFMWIGLNS